MSVILCTAGYDHTIRFWEALSGICSRTIPSPDSQVNRLCISPDKRFLAAAGHLNVKLFDIKSSNPNPVLTFQGHTTNITAVAFHCEGKWMVTSSEDGTVKIWDVRTGTIQRDYKHGNPVNDVVIHPNQGELISCDRIGAVRVWDLSENKCTHQLIPEDDVAMASVTVASDGSMLCSGNIRGYVFVWKMTQVRDPVTHTDTTSLIPICKFQAHGNYITRVLLSPDVQHLATCSADHTVRIWEVRHDDLDSLQAAVAARSSKNLAGGAATNGVSAGPDGNTVSKFKVAAAASLAPANATAAAPPPTTSTAHNAITSPATHAASTSTNTAAHTTATATAAATAAAAAAGASRTSSAASTHSTSSDADADGVPFELEMTLEGHQRWVWDCAFSADSAYLVTACSDHYARLWELNSQSIIRQYSGHHRGAVCVALNDTALG